MGEGSSGTGPGAAQPTGPGSHEPVTEIRPRQVLPGAGSAEPATDVGPRPVPPGGGSHEPATYVPPRKPATEAAPHQRPSEVLRYGPGVPAGAAESQAGTKAESVWRTGRLPEPPRNRARLRRLLGTALTVALLAVAGVLLFMRFHHAPFHVTGAEITGQTRNGCAVDVTGRIDTNGAAGTVTYQWLSRPQLEAPQPTSQSVVSGQHSTYVTLNVEGTGSHGSASQTVTLQVLGPDKAISQSELVSLSC
jgi:hypothetical protein